MIIEIDHKLVRSIIYDIHLVSTRLKDTMTIRPLYDRVVIKRL